jgi:hypothetical protein
MDGTDAWVGTSKGLGWARGEGYYPGLKGPEVAAGPAEPEERAAGTTVERSP